ncbi:MAG: hypothetical protein WDW36_007425 [Sanguina aurantia]
MLSTFNFRFPLLLSAAHAGFNFIALLPFMLAKARPAELFENFHRQFAGLIAVGLFFSMGLGLNNISLMTVPLSVNQMIRAGLPVFTAVFAIFIEAKTPTRAEFISLLALCGGVGIAVFESTQHFVSVFGVVACFVGSICSGLMVVTSGRLLTEKMDGLSLTFYTSPVVLVSLLPFVWQMELGEFLVYQGSHDHSYLGEWGGGAANRVSRGRARGGAGAAVTEPPASPLGSSSLSGVAPKFAAWLGRKETLGSCPVFYLMWGCVNACLYNVVHYWVIHSTSSVTTTVLGEVKIVLLLIFSFLFLGEENIWSVKMIVGCGISLAGFFMYSHCKLYGMTSLPANSPITTSGSTALLTSLGSTALPPLRSAPRRDLELVIGAGSDGALTPSSYPTTAFAPTAGSALLPRSLTPTKRQLMESMAGMGGFEKDVAIAMPSEGSDSFGAVLDVSHTITLHAPSGGRRGSKCPVPCAALCSDAVPTRRVSTGPVAAKPRASSQHPTLRSITPHMPHRGGSARLAIGSCRQPPGFPALRSGLV